MSDIYNAIMKQKYMKLKNYYGSHEAVAVQLGITGRHYRRVRKGESGSKSVFILIDLLINSVKMKDLIY